MALFHQKENQTETGQKTSFAEMLLIKSACKGDSRSFAKLVKTYEKRVKAMGMSFFKNETDVDDFIQDVFIKVFTGLASFRGESKFSTWIMRIAYNTAVNSVKRRKEYALLPENFEILDNDDTPEEKHIKKVTANVIRECVAQLPERFRMCLDMYFFYDMSYLEISVVSDLPVNTIKSHVFRAKKMLKERLEKEL